MLAQLKQYDEEELESIYSKGSLFSDNKQIKEISNVVTQQRNALTAIVTYNNNILKIADSVKLGSNLNKKEKILESSNNLISNDNDNNQVISNNLISSLQNLTTLIDELGEKLKMTDLSSTKSVNTAKSMDSSGMKLGSTGKALAVAGIAIAGISILSKPKPPRVDQASEKLSKTATSAVKSAESRSESIKISENSFSNQFASFIGNMVKTGLIGGVVGAIGGAIGSMMGDGTVAGDDGQNQQAGKAPTDGNAALIYNAAKEAGYDNNFSAAFVALANKESGLKPKPENLNYSAKRIQEVWPKKPGAVAYAGNPQGLANYVYGRVNGNRGGNDGWTYRGRGFVQLTGRGNYDRIGKSIGLDLVNNPDLLLQPGPAAKSLIAYMQSNHVLKGRKSANSLGEATRLATDAAGGRSGFSNTEYGRENLRRVNEYAFSHSVEQMSNPQTDSQESSSSKNLGTSEAPKGTIWKGKDEKDGLMTFVSKTNDPSTGKVKYETWTSADSTHHPISEEQANTQIQSRKLKSNNTKPQKPQKVQSGSKQSNTKSEDMSSFNLPSASSSGGIVALGHALEKLGFRVGEHPAFGGIKGRHSATGGHYTQDSIDVNVSTGINEATDPKWGPIFDKLATAGKQAGYHTLWRVKDHQDHIHFQYSGSMGKNSKIGGNKKEAIQQASAPRSQALPKASTQVAIQNARQKQMAPTIIAKNNIIRQQVKAPIVLSQASGKTNHVRKPMEHFAYLVG
jgi:hypothetical protein